MGELENREVLLAQSLLKDWSICEIKAQLEIAISNKPMGFGKCMHVTNAYTYMYIYIYI